MAATTSPTSGRRYGIAQVCRIWDVPRSSFYADRRRADTTRRQSRHSVVDRSPGCPTAPCWRDPRRSCPFALARRRTPQGVGAAAGDGRCPGRAQTSAAANARNLLLSPYRSRPRDGTPHDRKIITAAPNLMWATERVCRSKRRERWGLAPRNGLQEQVANRRKRRGSKARVVSVTEKARQASGGRQEGEHQ